MNAYNDLDFTDKMVSSVINFKEQDFKLMISKKIQIIR